MNVLDDLARTGSERLVRLIVRRGRRGTGEAKSALVDLAERIREGRQLRRAVHRILDHPPVTRALPLGERISCEPT